ncbi:MAG: TonB-dependent receptor [Flavobacteriaceae bacterium]|nr:TonB-dependent receptor [Flavobacteriaceae bacterium]
MSSKLFLLIFLFSIFPLVAQQNNQQAADTLQVVQLNEVQLEGIRATELTPFTFSNVTKEEVQPRNLGQDIPILLNFLPSVVTTSDAGNGIGYTSMRVRGSDATRINVTINGIPYNDSESHNTFWVDLPDFASSVESFQLQRGVGSSTNGTAAFGASLNIETRDISIQPFAEISNSIGSFNTIKNTLNFSSGLLNDQFELSGRLSHLKSDGYIERASSDLDSHFLQLAYQNPKTFIRLLLFGGHETTYQSWYGIDSNTLKRNRRYNPAGEIYDTLGNLTGFYDTQVDDYTQDHYQFLLNQQLKNNWNLRLALNYTYGRGYYQEYNDVYATQNIHFGDNINFSYLQIPELTIGQEQISITENITRKWLDNHFYVSTLGLNYTNHTMRLNFGGLLSHYSGDHFGELLWGHQLGAIQPHHRFYENLGLKYEQSAFGKLNYFINDHLSFYIDLQLRSIQYEVEGQAAGPKTFEVDDSFSFFNPKFGLTYNIRNQTKFYFSYAKAHREPNRTDFENGNPVPEELDNYELGFRSFADRGQWQINLYYMDYTNQLILTGQLDEVGAPIRENIGKSRRFGVEIESSLALTHRIHWQTAITLSSNQNIDYYFQRDGQLENLGNTHISYSPNFIGANILQYSLDKNTSINLLSKYVSSQYMGNIDSEKSKLDGYFINDLNFVYHLKPKRGLQELELSLIVNNVLDQEYISNGYFYTYDDDTNPDQLVTIEGAGYYPQAQINWLLGIRVSL